MTSNRSSALKCPSCRRNTFTIRSRLLERLPPAGRRLSRYADAVPDEGEVGCMTRGPITAHLPAGRPSATTADSELYVERRTAPAGRLGVGILDRESAASQIVHEIHLGPRQIP